MANNRSLRKTIETLEKKIVTLENQGFAQKLLVDDLESKIEQLTQRIGAKNSYGPGFNIVPAMPPTPVAIKDPCIDCYGVANPFHTWPTYGDSAGNFYCTVCNKYLNSSYGFTYTDNTLKLNPDVNTVTNIVPGISC